MRFFSTLLLAFFCLPWSIQTHAQEWRSMAAPTVGEKWVQPVQGTPARPVWGHANGIRIGLSPMPGPRGLIRIYTPYLQREKWKVMNFIAMEPTVQGSDKRGLSELEMSTLDNKRGKRFWSANDSTAVEPRPEKFPARGVVAKINGVETLTLFIFSERFENGAAVYVRIRFYANRPQEVEVTTYATKESKPLKRFIVTATMGNYARLRKLFLKDKTVTATQLWPDYRGDAFTTHVHFSTDDLIKGKNGACYFIAAPDEAHPADAVYAKGTANHWKYQGEKATQYWYCKDPDASLEGLVNGRYTYWASQSPIPGGIAFENFEMKSPFQQATTYVFGISPLSPKVFIKKIKGKSEF